MPIYDKPTKVLMTEWAREHLQPGKPFAKSDPVPWFKRNYPNIKSNTVEMHVEGMAVNSRSRRHHPAIKPGSGHDLFWKVGSGQFRLWDPASDPKPIYKSDIESEIGGRSVVVDSDVVEDAVEQADASFAYEKDLQNYLARNLHVLERGLNLYDDEGFNGIEYNAGGRFIDILAVGNDGSFTVIELKVSRGYDRVIGQLLRYMGWVEKNLANGKGVRGIIVANEITPDLILATTNLPSVKLFEYELSFSVKPVSA